MKIKRCLPAKYVYLRSHIIMSLGEKFFILRQIVLNKLRGANTRD